jgi:hypothetical protein
MRPFEPSERVQTASMLPDGSVEIPGDEALWNWSEICVAALQAPLGVRLADSMRRFDPSDRVQTATTFPVEGSTATCGSNPSSPAAETSMADKNVGVAWAVTGTSNTEANAKRNTVTRDLVKVQPLPLGTPARQSAS